jgi:hypothetical protein
MLIFSHPWITFKIIIKFILNFNGDLKPPLDALLDFNSFKLFNKVFLGAGVGELN